jgi:hypothetical protein
MANPKRPRKAPEPDFNHLAHRQIRMLTDPPEDRPGPSEISRVMAELGRRGGARGGAARAANMTAKQRSKAASLAAKARWASMDNTKPRG